MDSNMQQKNDEMGDAEADQGTTREPPPPPPPRIAGGPDQHDTPSRRQQRICAASWRSSSWTRSGGSSTAAPDCMALPQRLWDMCFSTRSRLWKMPPQIPHTPDPSTQDLNWERCPHCPECPKSRNCVGNSKPHRTHNHSPSSSAVGGG